MRKYGYQDPELRNILDKFRDNQPAKPRFTFNLPDCSLVETNQTNNTNNLIDTNEMSWLDKFTESNQKQSASDLLKESEDDQQIKNQMKFSFNQNYAFPPSEQHREIPHQYERAGKIKGLRQQDRTKTNKPKQESSNNVLKDILNTEGSIKQVRRKQHSVGSIKRNKVSSNISTNDKGKADREWQKLPIGQFDQMKDKFSTILKGDKEEKENSYRQDKIRKSVNQKIFEFDNTPREFNKRAPLHKESFFTPYQSDLVKPIKQKSASFSPSNITPHLQSLFSRLDKTQTGKLTKQNCCIQNIPEQFKFIFGNIFTRIKLKNLICNKKEFVKLCTNAINEIDSEEIIKLLKELSHKQDSNISFLKELNEDSRKTQSYNQTLNHSKSNSLQKKDLCSFRAPTPSKQTEIVPPRKISYEPTASQSYQKSYREQRYQNDLKYPQKIKQQNNKIEQQRQSKLFTDSKTSLENSSYSNPKNGVSSIKEHQKGLDCLMKLNNKISSCLNTKLLSQHSGVLSIRDESLRFDQLVKHI